MTDTGLPSDLLSPFTFALIYEGCRLIQGLFVPSDHGDFVIMSLGTFSGTRQCQPLMIIKCTLPTSMALSS